MKRPPYLAFVGIGNGAPTADNPRGVNRNEGRLGGNDDFRVLFDNEIAEAYRAGFRRFMLWQPFGLEWPRRDWQYTINGVPIKAQLGQYLDHYLLAREQGYTRLCDSFAPAVQRFLTACPDCEIIAYTGQGFGHPQLEAMGASELFARLTDSMRPFLDSGCSIAFDTACFLPEEHWQWRFMKLMNSRGVRTYIESQPWHPFTHLSEANFVADCRHFKTVGKTSIGPKRLDAGGSMGFIDPAKISGERVMLLVQPPPPRFRSMRDFYRAMVPALLADPWIDAVCMETYPFVAERGTVGLLEAEPAPDIDWRELV